MFRYAGGDNLQSFKNNSCALKCCTLYTAADKLLCHLQNVSFANTVSLYIYSVKPY